MTPHQLSLVDYEPVAQVRKHDPRTAKRAAAQNRDGRASQAVRILRHVREHGSITADVAYRDLTMSDEDVTRGEWSARLGVLVSRGLLERAGEVDERGRRGEVRPVLAYRLTREGAAEVTRMWGGVG